MNKKLVEKQMFAAAFLAAAAHRLLPKVQLIKSGIDQLGFYYDISLPYPLSESQLEELERIAMEISSHSKISFKEMMPENAKNYLAHLGQLKREINTYKSLIYVIEIDGFKDFIPISNPEISEGNFFIKLYKLINIEQNIYRIFGFVFENSKEYSKFLKKFKDYEKNNCLTIGKRRGWFDLKLNQLIFYPKGVILKNKLLNLISDELISLKFKPFQSFPTENIKFLRTGSFNLNKAFEVINGINSDVSEKDPFNTQTNLFIKQTILIFNNEFEQECISCLQSIIKMLNILSFRYEFRLCVSERTKLKGRKKVFEIVLAALGIKYELQNAKTGCKLNVFAKDKIAREWHVASLELKEDFIEGVFCSSLNRWIALLAESDELDFRVLPEHVRAILLDDGCIEYANEIKAAIEECGFRVDIDASDKLLNEKIFEAKAQEIPFIIVIGEKENKSKTIALRCDNKAGMQRIKICALLEKLKQKGKFENQ